jgi:hypothetical protein
VKVQADQADLMDLEIQVMDQVMVAENLNFYF